MTGQTASGAARASDATASDAADATRASDATAADAAPTAHATAAGEPAEDLPRPRVRFGAIAWGLLLMIAGLSAISILRDERSREAALDWLLGLTPFTIGAVAVLAAAALILLAALLTILRRWQVARGRAR